MPQGKSAQQVRDMAASSIEKMGWKVGKFLGEGAFGKVYLVTKEDTTAACKIIEKPKDKKQLDMIYNEISVMKSMNHPYIVKLYDAFQTEQHFFLFLELMTGGELFDKIIELGQLTEKMAAGIAVKCLLALKYVHKQGIVHRDLKPENLLLANKEPDAPIKLVDFGLSGMYDAHSALMTEPAGTPGYQAPEVLMARKNGGYDHQVDVWSFGVIIYILLSGTAPFFAPTPRKESEKIKAGIYDYPDKEWGMVSAAAKAFIDRMLVVDPGKRATIEQLLADPWLAEARREHDKYSASGVRAAPAVEASAFVASGPNLAAAGTYALKETEEALAARAKFATSWMKMKSILALQAAGRNSARASLTSGRDSLVSNRDSLAVDVGDPESSVASEAEDKKHVHFANSPGKPPPLPRGWSAHVSKDGSRFWYSCDADAKLTQWTVPGEDQAVETDLPTGWTAHKAKDGKRFFYWCAVSQQALWEPPGAERAVQEKLPRGWTANLAEDKVHFYYFCAEKNKTQWEVPKPYQAVAPKTTPQVSVVQLKREKSTATIKRISTARGRI